MMATSVNQLGDKRVERWTPASITAVAVVVAILVALIFVPLTMGPGTSIALTRLFAYVILAVTWNALAGYGGLVSVGQQGFFGLGAYAVIRFSDFGINPYLSIFAAAVAVGLLSIPISTFMLRLKEGRFAIGTWVLSELLVLLVLLDPIVNGSTGTSLTQIVSIAADTRRMATYWVALGGMVVILVTMFLLLRSAVGSSVQAIRDDEDAAMAVGVRVYQTKRILFVLSAAGAALGGGIWLANTITFQPNSFFSVQWAAFMIFMVLVGGIGTYEGAIIGAIIFFFVEEMFGATGVWYLIILGGVSLGFALFLPRGIWGAANRVLGLNLLPVGYRLRLRGAAKRGSILGR